MRELPCRAADFPDPAVGPLPARFEKIEQGALHAPGGFAAVEAHAPALVQHVEHFAEHIELKLGVRGVADADR